MNSKTIITNFRNALKNKTLDAKPDGVLVITGFDLVGA